MSRLTGLGQKVCAEVKQLYKAYPPNVKSCWPFLLSQAWVDPLQVLLDLWTLHSYGGTVGEETCWKLDCCCSCPSSRWLLIGRLLFVQILAWVMCLALGSMTTPWLLKVTATLTAQVSLSLSFSVCAGQKLFLFSPPVRVHCESQVGLEATEERNTLWSAFNTLSFTPILSPLKSH